MPNFDSSKAFDIYKKTNPEIPFLLVTGSAPEEYVVEMMKRGVDDYLLKDSLHKLPRAIRNAVSKREKEFLRKQGEEKLKQSELLLNKAEQIAHVGSFCLDLNTRKEVWSNGLYRILGLVPNEIEPSNEVLLSFVHPDDFGFIERNIKQISKSLQSMSLYNRIIRKDGGVRYVYFESKFEFDKEGKPSQLNGVIHDISDKVLAEEEKEFENRNLLALINNTEDLIWSVDKDFRLITANKAFDEKIKLLTGSPIAKGSKVLLPSFTEEQLARFKKFYTWAFAGEAFTEIVFDNSVWSEISFYPIRKDSVIIGTACFSRDITNRVKTEREVLQKNAQLKKLNSQLQNIREEERTAISREIHDELGQQLTALKMDIDWVKYKQNNSGEVVVSKLEKMLQMSDTIINTVRRISADSGT